MESKPLTDYDVAHRIEGVRNHLDRAWQTARSTECRIALGAADTILKALKADLGHPRAGLSGDCSPPGRPIGEVWCKR
jgi:hypothetical protein